MISPYENNNDFQKNKERILIKKNQNPKFDRNSYINEINIFPRSIQNQILNID